MPIKKEHISDAERARRIRETARAVETNNDPASFEKAFAKVVQAPVKPVSQPEKQK